MAIVYSMEPFPIRLSLPSIGDVAVEKQGANSNARDAFVWFCLGRSCKILPAWLKRADSSPRRSRFKHKDMYI